MELETKNSVGRPSEEKLPERVNLNEYKAYAKFERNLTKCFEPLYTIAKAKAPKPLYVANMEATFGGFLEKFELLSFEQQSEVLNSEFPLKQVLKITNFKLETAFIHSKDMEDFQEIIEEFKFK